MTIEFSQKYRVFLLNFLKTLLNFLKTEWLKTTTISMFKALFHIVPTIFQLFFTKEKGENLAVKYPIFYSEIIPFVTPWIIRSLKPA